MTKLYFNLRPASRDRMWDTAFQAQTVCDTSFPKNVFKNKAIVKNSTPQKSIKAILKDRASHYLVNKQNYDHSASASCDLLYFWGAFPKDGNTPYIVELDNPYSPCYYKLDNFKKNYAQIVSYLSNARVVTFMSEACRNHCIELYGESTFSHTEVIYPCVQNNLSSRDNTVKKDVVDFLFVGIDFRRKGGVELLEAFHATQNTNIRLTVVANVSDEYKAQYAKDSRIVFTPLLSRDTLFKTLYPRMDVLILPSFHESFGMVLLEAMSFGIAIITIDCYATGEMVNDGENGFLLPHPLIRPESFNQVPVINCVDLTITEFNDRYLGHNEFYYGLYDNLKQAISATYENIDVMQKNSATLFLEKFAPEIWNEKFKRIIDLA